MKRREFLTRSLGFATGAVGLVAAGPDGRAMASPAQGHRILDLELFDTARQRLVPVRLYFPQQASAESPVPLVVFSHGLGGSRMGYSYLARHWANAGLASLHPQHVGSDNSVWRVLDLRFALNHVLASDQGQLFNASSIAVAGHSYGANTAMLVAGAQVKTGNPNLTDLQDRRIKAAILISAPPLIGQGPARQVLGAVNLPTLHITSLEDTINLPGYRSTIEDRIAIFDAMTQSPRTLAVYNTGGHSIFTDRTTRSGPETSARIKAATEELCTIFLRRSLYFGYPPANTESMTAQPAVRTNPVAPTDAYEVQQDLSQWAYRHKDLLDRFTSRQT
jgi:pimeloyl-ACP methyl ester carboxylesterase